jgi:hypothetical protein
MMTTFSALLDARRTAASARHRARFGDAAATRRRDRGRPDRVVALDEVYDALRLDLDAPPARAKRSIEGREAVL